MNIETIVKTARLRMENGSADSCYFHVGPWSARVSGHARQSHHAASDLHRSADINILILDGTGAEDFAAWRAEAPREVAPAEVIVRARGERAATTAKFLRAILAAATKTLRHPSPEPTPENPSHEAEMWEAGRRACESWASKVPPLNTPGRKALVLELRRQAIETGISSEVAARYID